MNLSEALAKMQKNHNYTTPEKDIQKQAAFHIPGVDVSAMRDDEITQLITENEEKD